MLSYLLNQYPPRRVRHKNNRPRTPPQRGARTGQLNQQLLGMGKYVALLAQRFPIRNKRMITPDKDPRVRARRREQVQWPVRVGFGAGGALGRRRGELGELEAGRGLGGGFSEEAL